MTRIHTSDTWSVSPTIEITNLLKQHGVFEEFVEWQSCTPNWRNQIAAHHFSSGYEQGPESLRGYFRKVRNHITTDVSVWPNVAIDRREQRDGKFWLTKDEWNALAPNQREGRASKNSRTSKARAFIFSFTQGTHISVPVYVVDPHGHIYH